MTIDKKIIINNAIGETRVAVLENDAVTDIRLFRDHNPSHVGSVILGRVASLSREFQAAFVDIGNNQTGFLPLNTLPKTPGKKPKDLTELLHEGQRVIVQVVTDAADGKNVKLTGRVELVTPSIVFHPYRSGAFVSSRIKDPNRREELKKYGETMDLRDFGLTFRTNAEHVTNEQLSDVANNMVRNWKDATKDIKSQKCPSMLLQGSNPIEQALREFAAPDVTAILFDQLSDVALANNWVNDFAPELAGKVNHYHNKENIFSHFDIDDEIENLYSTQVTLNSGAWITIEHTEAMTVIDVNMGNARLSNDQQRQIFSLNREAAREIFRQLRLRSIGGIIVIDFVDMTNKGDIKSLLHFIDELMLNDPEPLQRGNLSSFGLLELTRKSRQLSLGKQLLQVSHARINIQSQCIETLRHAEQEALSNPGKSVSIKVNSEMKRWFEDHSELFDKFSKRTGSPLKMELK